MPQRSRPAATSDPTPRATMRHSSASSSAIGPNKKRSQLLDEAKLPSALSASPATSTQMPHRDKLSGTGDIREPARPSTLSAATTNTTAANADEIRSADSNRS